MRALANLPLPIATDDSNRLECDFELFFFVDFDFGSSWQAMAQTDSEIRTAYDLAAALYAEKFLDELPHKPLDRDLLQRFADVVGKEANIIDLGCGPGHTTAYLSSLGLSPLGVDLSPKMISIAQSQFPDQGFAVGDFHCLEYADNSFDGCLAFYCIVHLQQKQLARVFAEIRRVLKPHGSVLLAFHIGDEPVFVENFLECGAPLEFFAFPVPVVKQALVKAGFADIEVVERQPYETEYPTQRCYIFASKPRK